jgi:hypothetical protein
MIHRLYAWRSWLWLVPAVPAAVLTALILVVLPADQSLDNLAEWAFRLAPLVLAVLASHIAVFVGGPPSVATAVVFLLVHLVLATAVLTVPLGRWIDRALSTR